MLTPFKGKDLYTVKAVLELCLRNGVDPLTAVEKEINSRFVQTNYTRKGYKPCPKCGKMMVKTKREGVIYMACLCRYSEMVK